MATRLLFEQELQELRKSVADMGYQVESNYDRLFAALQTLDFGTVEAIVKNDRDVNDMERAVEAQCLHLITKQQPIARDLRVVSASLKVVTDIERIGDHVADIAELALRGGGECRSGGDLRPSGDHDRGDPGADASGH